MWLCVARVAHNKKVISQYWYWGKGCFGEMSSQYNRVQAITNALSVQLLHAVRHENWFDLGDICVLLKQKSQYCVQYLYFTEQCSIHISFIYATKCHYVHTEVYNICCMVLTQFIVSLRCQPLVYLQLTFARFIAAYWKWGYSNGGFVRLCSIYSARKTNIYLVAGIQTDSPTHAQKH